LAEMARYFQISGGIRPNYRTASERGSYLVCSCFTLVQPFITISFVTTVCFGACGSVSD
jgi:hypothetical protein